NVYRSGTLLQHIESPVNHEAGRKVAVAHQIEIEPGSKLAEIVTNGNQPVVLFGDGEAGLPPDDGDHVDATYSKGTGASGNLRAHIVIPANSSHHQSAEVIGDGLKIVARCPEDGIIEGLEGTSPDHFVLAVQWHPERSFEDDERSRAIFRALVESARKKHRELAGEFETA